MKDEKYIERIIGYATKIIRYLEEVKSVESFSANEEKVEAVLLNLEQIGETAKKLSVHSNRFIPILNGIK